jgi:hypothetical protein
MSIATNHAHARTSLCGVTSDLIDLVKNFGQPERDRTILNRKNPEAPLGRLRKIERVAKKVSDNGAFVAVETGGGPITAYNLEGFKRGCGGPR